MKKDAILIVIALLSLAFCNKSPVIDIPKDNMAYYESFNAAKPGYPFEAWKEYVNDGLDQYTEQNCNKAQKIMDDLIVNLARIGKDASEQEKVRYFKIAVEEFNRLNALTNIIETMEREEIFEIFEAIAEIAGIDTSKYGSGEGIASEWREW